MIPFGPSETRSAAVRNSIREGYSIMMLDSDTMAELQIYGNYLENLLKSPDYQNAIRKCFPNRPDLQTAYTLDITRAYFKGRTTGTVLGFGTYILFGRVFQSLAQYLPAWAPKVIVVGTGIGASLHLVSLMKRSYEWGLSEEEKRRSLDALKQFEPLKEVSQVLGDQIRSAAILEKQRLERLIVEKPNLSDQDRIEIQKLILELEAQLSNRQ